MSATSFFDSSAFIIPDTNFSDEPLFAQRMEGRRGQDAAEEFKVLKRGWCLGDEQFRQQLLEEVSTRPGPSHFGEAVQEAVEVQADRLIPQQV